MTNHASCSKIKQVKIRSLVYSTLDKLMLDLLCKDIIGNTLITPIAKLFSIDAAADMLSQGVWAKIIFMAIISTFVRHKTDTIIEKCSTSFATKDPTTAVETNKEQ